MKSSKGLLVASAMAGLMTLGFTPAFADPSTPMVMLIPPPPPPLAPVAFSNQVWAPLQLALFPPAQIPDFNCKVCGLRALPLFM